MDPNATLEILKDSLEEIEAACDNNRKDLWALHNSDAERYCAELTAWLAKGGFQPDWYAHPRAAAFYLDRVWQIECDPDQDTDDSAISFDFQAIDG